MHFSLGDGTETKKDVKNMTTEQIREWLLEEDNARNINNSQTESMETTAEKE